MIFTSLPPKILGGRFDLSIELDKPAVRIVAQTRKTDLKQMELASDGWVAAGHLEGQACKPVKHSALRLPHSAGSVSAMLERIRKPAVLIGADRSLEAANHLGRQVLEDPAGMLAIEQDKLRMALAASDKALTHALETLGRNAGAVASEIFIPGGYPHGEKWLGLSVSAVNAGVAAARSEGKETLLVILHPKARERRVDALLLQGAFNLTPTEARVAKQIFEGMEPLAICQEQGTSITTVRSHIARIFEKTAVTRQTDLVLKIADLLSH